MQRQGSREELHADKTSGFHLPGPFANHDELGPFHSHEVPRHRRHPSTLMRQVHGFQDPVNPSTIRRIASDVATDHLRYQQIRLSFISPPTRSAVSNNRSCNLGPLISSASNLVLYNLGIRGPPLHHQPCPGCELFVGLHPLSGQKSISPEQHCMPNCMHRVSLA